MVEQSDLLKVFVVAEGLLGVSALQPVLSSIHDVEYVGAVTPVTHNVRGGHRAEDLRRVAQVAASADCDLVCVDGFSLGAAAMTEVLRDMTRQPGCPPVLVVLGAAAADREELAKRSGAQGAVVVTDDLDRLADALRLVASGYSVFSSDTASAPASPARSDPPRSAAGLPHDRMSFTDQERNVLLYVAQGMSNAEIAVNADLSASTVKFMIQRMRIRLGLDNRASLAAFALRSKVTDEQPRS